MTGEMIFSFSWALIWPELSDPVRACNVAIIIEHIGVAIAWPSVESHWFYAAVLYRAEIKQGLLMLYQILNVHLQEFFISLLQTLFKAHKTQNWE